MSMEQTQDRLIEACETAFLCEQGPAKAFFEIPQRVGDPVRVIYVSYVATGSDLDELELWFVQNVLQPLAKAAPIEAYLYWRLSSRIVVYSTQTHGNPKDYVIRTRIAVLDKDLEPVVVEDTVTPEGGLITRVGE